MSETNSIMASRNVVKGAAAFSKGIAILQLIAESPQPPSVATLVRQSGLPRPTLHRLLKALSAEGLVEATYNKTYTLGARMVQLASRALEQNDIARVAEPALDWLCAKTQETIHLAIRVGNELVYLQKKDSPQTVRIASSLGSSVALHGSAIGKCFMAFLSEDERMKILDELDFRRLTKYTTTDREQLKVELARIARDGYSIAHQETDLEIECYGACLLNRKNEPVGGISISVPLYRKNSDLNVYLRPLMECRDRIMQKLGRA